MPALIHIGPIAVQTYTLTVTLGILGGCLTVGYFGASRGFRPEQSLGACLWTIALALVGGRAAHLAANWSGYAAQPALVLQMGRPLAFHGMLAGGMLGLALYASLKHLVFGALADVMAMGFAVVQAFGWIGALSQGLGHGLASYDGWAWELPDVYGVAMPRFPTQAVGSLMAGAIFWVLWAAWRKRDTSPGSRFGTYLFMNSALFFALEFARADESRMIGPLRLGQVAYLAELALAACLLIYLRRSAQARAGADQSPN